MRKWIPVFVLAAIFLLAIQAGLAQGDVSIFFVACENQAVMNLTGNMPAGYDVYFQVFSGAGGTGTAITAQRQASVDGVYAFSEIVPYNSGATVAAGGIASARIIVGREGNPSSATFDTTVDDVQDGCNQPQNAVGTSVDLSVTSAAVAAQNSGIQSPFGGILNPPVPAATPQPIVVIGARRPAEVGRSQTPGVIFAECNQFMNRADPGLVYDTDNIVVFWSWFARTPELAQEHINNAMYSVSMNGVSFSSIAEGGVSQRGANYFVFYTVSLGPLAPGFYRVDYNLIWQQAISDGYESFGPGTNTPQVLGNCTFEVKPNPLGRDMTEQYSTVFKPF